MVLLYHYVGSRWRYRIWLKAKLQEEPPEVMARALRREWRTYYGELAQVLDDTPLSP